MGFQDILLVLTEVGDIYRINSFGLHAYFFKKCRAKLMVFPTQEIMYTSLFDTFFADSVFSPIRTVYVVSDSKLEEIKLKQRRDELNNLKASRKKLEESYQSRIKIIDEREHELQEKLKALAPVEKKNQTN